MSRIYRRLAGGDQYNARLGARIKHHRQRLGRSQASLADALVPGSTYNWVARTEDGNARLDVDTMIQAEAELGLPVGAMLVEVGAVHVDDLVRWWATQVSTELSQVDLSTPDDELARRRDAARALTEAVRAAEAAKTVVAELQQPEPGLDAPKRRQRRQQAKPV